MAAVGYVLAMLPLLALALSDHPASQAMCLAGGGELGTCVAPPPRDQVLMQLSHVNARTEIGAASQGGMPLRAGTAVFLQGRDGKFATLEPQNGLMFVNRDAADAWERFTVESDSAGSIIRSGDRVYLRAHTGKRVVVEDDGTVRAGPKGGGKQALGIERLGGEGLVLLGDAVHFRTSGGRRLTVTADQGSVRATATTAGASQEFLLVAAEAPQPDETAPQTTAGPATTAPSAVATTTTRGQPGQAEGSTASATTTATTTTTAAPATSAAAAGGGLALGDVCYRFCEDGSEDSVDRQGACPQDKPCTSSLPAGPGTSDACGKHAHTCGGGLPTRFLSFNVFYKDLSSRTQRVAQAIKRTQAEVVSLQEAVDARSDILAAIMSATQQEWAMTAGAANGCGWVWDAVVMYRSDIWKELESGVLPYGGSSCYSNELRGLTWAALKRSDGKGLLVYATHPVCCQGDQPVIQAVELAARDIAARQARYPFPVVLMGDFNTGYHSPSQQLLRQGSANAFGRGWSIPMAFHDAYAEQHPENPNPSTIHNDPVRLDYVYFQRSPAELGRVVGGQVWDLPESGSDHRAVSGDVILH